jgi:hypothetical protein
VEKHGQVIVGHHVLSCEGDLQVSFSEL